MQLKPTVVTGVAGFVGFHLAKAIIQSGGSVVGLDNLNDYYDVGLKEARLSELLQFESFRFERLDLANADAVAALVAKTKPEVVIHLAAQAGVRYSIDNPGVYAQSNLVGFLSVLEACRATPVQHLVYASSSSVYGTNKKVPFSEDDPVLEPVSLYAATKRANEMMARTYAHLYRIPISGLRFFTVYGPFGRPDMAYFGFTKAITEGRPINLFNNGQMLRDFTYVDDVIEGILRLVEYPPGSNEAAPLDSGGAPHAIYNIGNNKPVELSRFVEAIETALSVKAERNYLPMQPGDVPATFADIRRLERLTGFRPRTSIEDGIAKFVEWYRGYYSGGRSA
ncbi:NAD-dependent epimerase/dehydratase family protein [Fulvimarina sp. MAC8]|uniref:NAD-dependent epimerase/dehydratase family protein n=1 Tax=Fulvimarina sp. MAC8 TaxID=3162874 RepID=UPI0032ECF0B5